MKVKEIPVSFFYSVYLRYFVSEHKIKKKIPTVISLTSIPSRLPTLDIVIKSLLNQTVEPELITLWLNHSLSKKIPKRLLKLQGDKFKIQFCEGTSSFRKLLPSLNNYPNSIIVTCDDDVIYPSSWLQHLYDSHLKEPHMVISQVGRLISYDENNELHEYKQWPYINSQLTTTNLIPIGYGGVLYPPDTFNKQVLDESLYMKLCPYADDLWFKAMAYLNGKSAYCASEIARPIPIIRSQKKSLGKTNIKKNGNCEQWKSLYEHFPELRELS